MCGRSTPPGPFCHNKPPPLTQLVRLGKKVVAALLDTSSSVSLIQTHLVPQDCPILRYTTVASVYRQVCRCMVVWMTIGYNGQFYSMDTLKVDDLLFPMLLGRDAPDFDILLCDAISTVSATVSDDDKAGPSGLGDDTDLMPGVTGWKVNTAF